MAGDHGAPEAGQLPSTWTRESPKRERRKESVAGQCRMRWEVSWDECPQELQEGFSILPILERYEPKRRLCPLQRRRERAQRAWRGSTSSSVEIEGTCVSKNFDETVRLQSEKRQEWIRGIRAERLQGIAEGTSSAPRLAISSAALFPRRNECPGIHCSLIEQEEKEDSSCQICHRVWGKRKDRGEDRVARTERESDRRRREEKRQTCWCCQDQQRACRMAQASVEKREHTGPAEKERVASVPHSSWQERQSRLC